MWTFPFVNNGRELEWADAMALFTDRTGRAGPSTWEVGDYPEGQDDYPVTGVSWFEAAAYPGRLRLLRDQRFPMHAARGGTCRSAQLQRRIELPFRDYASETPVTEEAFRLFLRQCQYDRTPLNPRVESVDQSASDDWIKETITFDAAYGGERVRAYLYLPRRGSPPYQLHSSA